MVQRLTFADVDANFDLLAHWSGEWTSGTYKVNEVVAYRGGAFICVNETTKKPYASSDWVSIPARGTGGMNLSASATGPNLSTTWETVPLDSVHLPGVGMSLVPGTGKICFSWPGIWWVNVAVYFSHNESVSTRSFKLRIYNSTKSDTATEFEFPVLKDQTESQASMTFAVGVLEENLMDTFRLEAYGATAVTSVVWKGVELTAHQVTATGDGLPRGRFASSAGVSSAVAVGFSSQASGSSSASATATGIGQQHQSPFSSAGVARAIAHGSQAESQFSAAGSSTAEADALSYKAQADGSSTAEAESDFIMPDPDPDP